MPPKKTRRTKAPRPAPPPPPPPPPVEEQEQEQPDDPRHSPLPDEEEPATLAVDPFPELEPEPDAEEAVEDAPARRRAAAPKVVTNFSEEEKEFIIEFLQQNPTLYSKRLAGYKDAASERQTMDGAGQEDESNVQRTQDVVREHAHQARQN